MKLPYLICEIGLNHDGSLTRAVQMIYAIAEAGRGYAGGIAAKFQAVFPDRLCTKTAPVYFQQDGNPAQTQHEFFSRSATFSRADYEHLAQECRSAGIDFLCTAFDVETVGWLAPLVKAFKVASADITNLPLLEAIAAYGKPIYLSTGAATQIEVANAVRGIAKSRINVRRDLTFLHCVLAYPTPTNQAALSQITALREFQRGDWSCPVGYSDHTLFNLDVLTTAWLLGASVIEKHFTLDKGLPGNDHYHSADAADLKALIAKFQFLQTIIGDGEKRVLPIEEVSRQYARRGLYAARPISAGKVLEAADVAILRPTARLGPERYAELIGQPFPESRAEGEPL